MAGAKRVGVNVVRWKCSKWKDKVSCGGGDSSMAVMTIIILVLLGGRRRSVSASVRFMAQSVALKTQRGVEPNTEHEVIRSTSHV